MRFDEAVAERLGQGCDNRITTFVNRRCLRSGVHVVGCLMQQEYEDTLVNPYVAAERGYLDAVIPPSHTRGQIVSALRLLERKPSTLPPKKHGSIPL